MTSRSGGFVPGYWQNETGGELASAVTKYLAGGQLDDRELMLVRAYLRQWLRGEFRGPGVDELRSTIRQIETTEQLRAWLNQAIEYGIDPL